MESVTNGLSQGDLTLLRVLSTLTCLLLILVFFISFGCHVGIVFAPFWGTGDTVIFANTTAYNRDVQGSRAFGAESCWPCFSGPSPGTHFCAFFGRLWVLPGYRPSYPLRSFGSGAVFVLGFSRPGTLLVATCPKGSSGRGNGTYKSHQVPTVTQIVSIVIDISPFPQ